MTNLEEKKYICYIPRNKTRDNKLREQHLDYLRFSAICFCNTCNVFINQKSLKR